MTQSHSGPGSGVSPSDLIIIKTLFFRVSYTPVGKVGKRKKERKKERKKGNNQRKKERKKERKGTIKERKKERKRERKKEF